MQALVIYPLMPKGVEHRHSDFVLILIIFVIYPLMPKGVEHLSIPRPLLVRESGDLSFDAERR